MSGDKIGRRRLMAIASGIAASGFASVVSASPSRKVSSKRREPVDYEFNPDKDRELKQFVRDFESIDDEQYQTTVMKNLSRAQRTAVNRARLPKSHEIQQTVDSKEKSRKAKAMATSRDSRDYQYTVVGESYAGTTTYKFHHDIEWEYDGDDVYDIEHYGDTSDLAWGYHDEGNNTKWIRDDEWAGNEAFESYRKRKFTYGAGVHLSMYPYSKLTGDCRGIHVLRDYDADDDL